MRVRRGEGWRGNGVAGEKRKDRIKVFVSLLRGWSSLKVPILEREKLHRSGNPRSSGRADCQGCGSPTPADKDSQAIPASDNTYPVLASPSLGSGDRFPTRRQIMKDLNQIMDTLDSRVFKS